MDHPQKYHLGWHDGTRLRGMPLQCGATAYSAGLLLTARCYYSAVLLQCGATTVRCYYSAVLQCGTGGAFGLDIFANSRSRTISDGRG